MKRVILALVTGATLWLCASVNAGEDGYYRWPTVHGDDVVFVSEADLWKVPVSGGLATRLTSHPANEVLPRFSPDGKWIAFTGDYLSSGDVYVIPATGGEPRRLTFHPVRDEVIGWTPDGESVLFRARRTGRAAEEMLYSIAVEGGEPEHINIGPASLVSYSQDGSKIAFNRHSWTGTWKRYRGGTAPDIWVGDVAAGKFWQLTKDDAVDQNPMWVGDRVFYLSERAGTVNLFSSKPDGSDTRQHTRHTDHDVRQADTDGKRIVYNLGADLWVFDVASGESRKIDIRIPSDRIRQQPRAEDASKTLESFALNHDGKRIALGSRGEIWTTGTKPGGRIISVTGNSSGTRERASAWSPDCTKLAVITDETGEQEIAIFDPRGREDHKILTRRGKGWMFPPIWSPDGKYLLSADLTGTMLLIDAESGDAKEVDQDSNWELTQFTFSPDAKWIAYRKIADNRMEMIWLYNIDSGEKTTISSGFTSDYSPSFDPTGKYLYFLSNRTFNPYMDDLDREFIVTRTAKPVLVLLAKDGKSPFLPDELLEEDDDAADEEAEEDGESPTTDAAEVDDEDREKELPEVRIDLEGIQMRQIELPVDADNYTDLHASDGRVFYLVHPMRGLAETDGPTGPGGRQDLTLKVFGLEDKEESTYVDGVGGYVLSGDRSRVAYRKGKTIFVTDASTKPGDEVEERIDVSKLPLLVDTADEWQQIFAEAWRLQRDFYWAENMVGVDWPAMRDRYAPLVERAGTRGELNDIIGQLIGELATSHTYVWGGDSSFQPPSPVAVGVLGADVTVDADSGLHRFKRVYRAEPWETDIVSPLSAAHANVKDGEYLLKINGRALGRTDSVDERLQNLAGVQVELTVGSKSDGSDARDIQIETLRDDSDLRYADWCRRNREYVEQKTSGQIGYFHLPDMGGAGLVRFVKGFYPQIDKPALLIDARDNGGGFVSQMMIQRLARKPLHFSSPRRGMLYTYPDRAHIGHKAVLVNEFAGSDGDIFPDSFRRLGLGPLIGMRTWGGVIGIRSDKPFIDAGMSTQPEFAWWDVERGWDIENVGVSPDLVVEYRPEDYIAGRDPQLDRGIEELMKKLRDEPVKRPTPPPFPDRSGRPAGPQQR